MIKNKANPKIESLKRSFKTRATWRIVVTWDHSDFEGAQMKFFPRDVMNKWFQLLFSFMGRTIIGSLIFYIALCRSLQVDRMDWQTSANVNHKRSSLFSNRRRTKKWNLVKVQSFHYVFVMYLFIVKRTNKQNEIMKKKKALKIRPKACHVRVFTRHIKSTVIFTDRLPRLKIRERFPSLVSFPFTFYGMYIRHTLATFAIQSTTSRRKIFLLEFRERAVHEAEW